MRRPSIVRLFLLVSLSIVALLLASDHAGAGKLSRPSRGVAQAGASQKAALSPFSIAHPLPVSTLTVTNTNDAGSGSLRQAIIDASSGETIKFSVTGTIRLTSGQLTIDKNLTINGPGANLLTISGNNDDQWELCHLRKIRCWERSPTTAAQRRQWLCCPAVRRLMRERM